MNIPSQYRNDVVKVLDSLGGENYSYYNIDVTKIADPESKSKIAIALRVIVAQSERIAAAQNIKNALEKDGFYSNILEDRGGKRLDVPINGGKIIRIDIKPQGGGSGAGAKETARNESAQCLYLALRQYVFKRDLADDELISENEFNEAYQHIEVDVKYDDLLMLSPEWKLSSIRGANKISEELGNKKYKFYRGKGFDDKEIKNAFSRIRSQTPFSSEDKWNPADIWIASTDFNPKELDSINTIDGLNQFLLEKYQSKQLIGVSLKKVERQPTLQKKNYDKAAKIKKAASIGFKKYQLIFSQRNQYPMDLYIYFGSGPQDRFQARNFGGDSTGSFQLELKGVSANQGRIGGGSVYKIIETLGIKETFNNTQLWSDCGDRANLNKKKQIAEEIYTLLKKYNAEGLPDKGSALSIIMQQKQSYKYSKLSGLRLLDSIKSSGKADEIVKELYLYGSSEGSQSGFYLKLQ
jgi:hypothetical protein